jgi:PPM family protein phosphatase
MDGEQRGSESSGALDVMSAAVQVEFGAMTHTGKVRPNNEDHYLIARQRKVLETVRTSLSKQENLEHAEIVGYLMVVADGVGGAVAGERASAIVLQEIEKYMLYTARWFLRNDQVEDSVLLQNFGDGLARLERALFEAEQKDPSLAGMATTMTAARSVGTDLLLANVGDSRAYLFHSGHLEQLTRDHTVAQEMVDQGLLRPEQVRHHQMRNRLTQAIGGGAGVHGDVHKLQIADRDRLLLCTDGLHDMVPNDEIAEILRRESNPQQACQALTQSALDHGGRDNITMVLADYKIVAPTRCLERARARPPVRPLECDAM